MCWKTNYVQTRRSTTKARVRTAWMADEKETHSRNRMEEQSELGNHSVGGHCRKNMPHKTKEAEHNNNLDEIAHL
jgi:hypothetical protein